MASSSADRFSDDFKHCSKSLETCITAVTLFVLCYGDAALAVQLDSAESRVQEYGENVSSSAGLFSSTVMAFPVYTLATDAIVDSATPTLKEACPSADVSGDNFVENNCEEISSEVQSADVESSARTSTSAKAGMEMGKTVAMVALGGLGV